MNSKKYDKSAVWFASDLEQQDNWNFSLDQTSRDHLKQMIKATLDKDRPLFNYKPDEFDLGPAGKTIAVAMNMAHYGRGIALLSGLPRDGVSEQEFELLNWAIGLHSGVARPQGRASQYISSVRDAGTDYRAATGRGYSSNAKLDFHADGCDLATLACYNKAKSGGQSMISSSVTAWQVMCAERPDLAEIVHGETYYFSRQGEETEDEGPFYGQPLVDFEEGRLFAKWNRNRIMSAQNLEGVPKLTELQREASDLFDAILKRPDIMYTMYLKPGDLQILNNHVTLHSRTNFIDHGELEKKRLLCRLWLATPNSVPLPKSWDAYFHSVKPGSVRGGIRGHQYDDKCRIFEHRQAAYLGMH